MPWRSAWIYDRGAAGQGGRRGRYRVCWIDDYGRQRSLSYASKTAAETARRLKERELNSWAVPTGEKTWPELITEYGMALATASPGHQDMTARLLGRFQAICHPTTANRISPEMCDQFLAARAAGQPFGEDDQPLAVCDETLRRDYRMLCAFCEWCTRRGYMERNPMKSIRPPGRVHRSPRAPRARDWLALLEALNDDDLAVHDPQGWHILILLAVVTGYRQSVLLHTYFGVDVLDRPALKVLETRHRRDGGFSVVRLADTPDGIGLLHTFSGKTRKEAIVGLPRVVTDRIGVRISELPEGTSRLFGWARWQRKAWERINRRAAVNLTFHSLRAAAGTRAAMAKASRAAADLLDHAAATVTVDHYLDQEQIAAAVALGQNLPELPPMPPYTARSAIQSMPGRRPRGSGSSAPPAQTAGLADDAASRPVC